MMTSDGIEFEYSLIRRLNNKIRITCETEQLAYLRTRDRFESELATCVDDLSAWQVRLRF